MKKYELKYWFEYGGGLLWPKNKAAYDKFDVGPIEYDKLNLSIEVKNEMQRLENWFQSSLDWDYPPDPSPWTQEEKNQFKEASNKLLNLLRKELEEEYEIFDENHKYEEIF